MRSTLPVWVLAVLIPGAGIDSADAQTRGRLLLFDPPTGVTASVAIRPPGVYALAQLNRETFEPLRNWDLESPAQVRARVAVTPSGFYVENWERPAGASFGQLLAITTDGTMRRGPRGPGCGFRVAQLVPAGDSILCVGQAGEVAVGQLDRDGGFVRQFARPAGALRTYSAVVNAFDYLLLYDAASGATAVGQVVRNRLTGEHRLEIVETATTEPGYRIVLAAGGNRVFLYDPVNGAYETARITIFGAGGEPGDPERRLSASYNRAASGRLDADAGYAV
mgnify:CR=1 FL=1